MASHTSTPREDTVDWGTPSQQRSNPSTGQSNETTPPQNPGTTTQPLIEVDSTSSSSVQEVHVRPPSNGAPPPGRPEDAREQHEHVSGGRRRRYDDRRKRSSIPADRGRPSRGKRRRSTAYRNTSSSSSISPPRRSTRPSRSSSSSAHSKPSQLGSGSASHDMRRKERRGPQPFGGGAKSATAGGEGRPTEKAGRGEGGSPSGHVARRDERQEIALGHAEGQQQLGRASRQRSSTGTRTSYHGPSHIPVPMSSVAQSPTAIGRSLSAPRSVGMRDSLVSHDKRDSSHMTRGTRSQRDSPLRTDIQHRDARTSGEPSEASSRSMAHKASRFSAERDGRTYTPEPVRLGADVGERTGHISQQLQQLPTPYPRVDIGAGVLPSMPELILPPYRPYITRSQQGPPPNVTTPVLRPSADTSADIVSRPTIDDLVFQNKASDPNMGQLSGDILVESSHFPSFATAPAGLESRSLQTVTVPYESLSQAHFAVRPPYASGAPQGPLAQPPIAPVFGTTINFG